MFYYLRVSITNIDRSCYPPNVEFYFTDFNNQTITIVEKLDIISSYSNISFPIEGYFLKCEIIEETCDQYVIDISKPYGVLSVDDRCLFNVGKNMISNIHFDDILYTKDVM